MARSATSQERCCLNIPHPPRVEISFLVTEYQSDSFKQKGLGYLSAIEDSDPPV